MGTRINVLLDHRVPDVRDRPAVLERLSTLRAPLAVEEYWLSVISDLKRKPRLAWTADPEPSWPVKHVSFTGPGGLFVSLTSVAARIHTGGRWRGFLSIDPLREVHVEAFRSIARALEATRLACFADNDQVDDLFWDGKSQEECIALLERTLGTPQSSVESIDPRVVRATDRRVPSVWFLEKLDDGP